MGRSRNATHESRKMQSDNATKPRSDSIASYVHARCMKDNVSSMRLILQLHHVEHNLLGCYYRDTGITQDADSNQEYQSIHSWGATESKNYHESNNTNCKPNINTKNRVRYYDNNELVLEYNYGMSLDEIKASSFPVFMLA